MFAAERIKIIKNHLIKEEKVSTAMLSELLDVSEVTIRRDLEKLELEGFLERTHGGAILTNYNETIYSDNETDLFYQEQRREIADTAFHLINDGDTLMLTEGLTNLQIARKIKEKKNLTILTNDIRIASEYANVTNNNLIMLGGDLEGHGVYGQMVYDTMSNFYFHHLFAEVDGISNDIGLTVSTIKKASLIQKAMKLSSSCTVISLSKNFGHKSFYRVSDFEGIKQLVTDSSIEASYKKFLYEINIPLFTSINLYEG